MNYYESIMSPEEQQQMVGATVEKLAQCVTNLNRLRKQAHGVVLALRVLADCFDEALPEVNILEIHEHSQLTFSDTREKGARYKFPLSRPYVQAGAGGVKRPLVQVPDGSSLMELIENIQNLSSEAAALADQLRNEGVDVTAIHQALARRAP